MKTTILMSLVILCSMATSAVAQDEVAQGKKLLEAGKFEEAAASFQAALDKDEESFDARSGLAEAKLGSGEFDSAYFHAVKAEKLKPEDLYAIELTGRAFKAAGDDKLAGGSDPSGMFAEAITSYTKLTEKDPKNADHHATLGYLLYYSNRTEESGDAYAQAFKLAKKNAEYAFLAAQSYNLAPKHEQAKAMIESAIKIAPETSRYQMMRGQVLGNMKLMVEAGQAFGDVLVCKDATPELRNTAASYMWNCFSPSKSWKPYSERLSAWTKKEPRNDFAWWWLGYVQFADGAHGDAYTSYGKASKVRGGWAEAIYFQGLIRLAEKKEDDALKLFKKSASMPYDWSNVFSNGPIFQMQVLMGQYYSSGNFKRAAEVAEDYCLPAVSGQTKIEIMSNIALFHRDWGGKAHNDDARDWYDDALEEAAKVENIDDKFMAQLLNDTAIVYQYAQRHFYNKKDGLDIAIKHLKRALDLDETNTDACLNYGLILRSKGMPKEALEVVKKGIPREDLNGLRARLEREVGQ